MAEIENQSETSLGVIPTPLNMQIKRLRYQVLPILIFVISLVLTAYLWKHYAGAPSGYGEVNAVTVRISAPHDGVLAEGEFPQLFEHVEARQTVARFDAGKYISEQERVQEELSKLQKQLEAADKAVVDAQKTGVVKTALDDLKRQATMLTTQVAERRTVFNQIEKQIRECTIAAPISGTITRMTRQPNEFVKQGEELITITQDAGSYITSYVRVGAGIVPKKDQQVRIAGQDGRRWAISRVSEVGTQIEQIPEHQLVNPKKPEWGIPVKIAMPDPTKLSLRPGELVVLNYLSDTN